MKDNLFFVFNHLPKIGKYCIINLVVDKILKGDKVMDYFINDTQTRILVAETQLKTAKTEREQKILREKIKDLHTLKEVLEDVKEHSMSSENVLKM